MVYRCIFAEIFPFICNDFSDSRVLNNKVTEITRTL